MIQQSSIAIELLENMFADIRAHGGWDIDGDMLWGYFFTSLGRQGLEQIGRHLEASGYRLVGTRELERESSDDAPEWQLHVERIEVHTVETLNTRNIQFDSLAERYTDVIYDGMDVGPASDFPTDPPND